MVAERVERYTQQSSKTREQAFGKLYMQQLYGGADKLLEAVESGEVEQVEGENGMTLFKMTCYEKMTKTGKRTY